MDKRTARKICFEAYNLFAKIPEENWTIRRFTNHVDACCAIGHHIRLKSKEPNEYSFTTNDILPNQTDIYKAVSLLSGMGIHWVNDGHEPEYQQRFPKARVMALLNDILFTYKYK